MLFVSKLVEIIDAATWNGRAFLVLRIIDLAGTGLGSRSEALMWACNNNENTAINLFRQKPASSNKS